jgi:LysM repeat protein
MGITNMRFLIYIAFLCVFSVSCGSVTQEQYRSHKVEKGETAYSIAKKYGTTEEVIYRLNPDTKNGIKVNSVIILPSNAVVANSTDDIKFKEHRVKRKETLFGISQQYNISIYELKKYNKELYSRDLKKGEKIMIPVRIKNNSSKPIVDNNKPTTKDTEIHIVQPKETKFGIARKYGISIAELDKLNPSISESLPIGAELIVPNTPVIPSATIEDNFDFYEVEAKEGFYRLKVKLGLTEEEIVALNPYAKDGLKEGMILKIPKKNSVIAAANVKEVDLENRISNTKKKHIALMLPFRLNEVNADSLSNNVDFLKSSGVVGIALDFYSGVLMAAEFAKDKGISVVIDVYDTEFNDDKVSSIISKNNFDNVDAVIGPLSQKNVEKAATMLKESNTPIFSPLSNREIKSSSNLFQTLPTDKMLEETMIDYLVKNKAGKNYILISDATKKAQKASIMEAIPTIKTVSPREKGYLYVGDISSKVESGMENWIILESTDPVIVSNVVGLLNGMPSSNNLRLFTLDKNSAYDYHDVSNMHLAKLGFTFPSVNKGYHYNEKNPFLISYKNKYGVLPNRYAVRGFDVMYDVILRLASADDVYKATESDYETEYIENKFRYTKELFSGYQNNASYIIKYKTDLQFEVVK